MKPKNIVLKCIDKIYLALQLSCLILVANLPLLIAFILFQAELFKSFLAYLVLLPFIPSLIAALALMGKQLRGESPRMIRDYLHYYRQGVLQNYGFSLVQTVLFLLLTTFFAFSVQNGNPLLIVFPVLLLLLHAYLTIFGSALIGRFTVTLPHLYLFILGKLYHQFGLLFKLDSLAVFALLALYYQPLFALFLAAGFFTFFAAKVCFPALQTFEAQVAAHAAAAGK
ncbi:hypothetical protein [Lacticaseibacillus suihuaensis]